MDDNDTTQQKPAEISLTITENHENEDDPNTQEEKKEEQQVDKNTPTFTCEICIEPIDDSSDIRTVATSCMHPYCTDCMVRYIRTRLEDDRGPTARIKCPSPDCPRELDPEEWAGPVGPALFVRWCDALCESSLSGLDACRCPRPSCGELVVSECGGGGATKSRCPKCKTDFCFACKRFWHAGSQCGEQQATGRSGSAAAFRRLAKRKHWKRCPSCQHYVELNGGCNSVICRCGTSFCYGCGRIWTLCNCRERWMSMHRCCRVIGFTMLVVCAGLVLLVPFLPFLLMS